MQDDRSGGRMQDFVQAQEGQALDDSTARTLQPELSSPFDVVPPPFVEHDRLGMQERKHFVVKGEAMDVSTARTLHPEISSPFDFLESSICDAILQNLRQRSNQFLVEDSRLRGD